MEAPDTASVGAAPLKLDEATWRSRDLKKAVESFSKDFLAREITLGKSTGQRMGRMLDEVRATKTGLAKVQCSDCS